MKTVDDIRHELGDDWLPTIYAEKVRTLRTRSFAIEVQPRENKAEIMHTLLGIELKVGQRRFACPDLATARYVRVFARIGCDEFAVPYDITRISSIADELETSWQRMLLLVEPATHDSSAGRARSGLVKAVRMAIKEIGPGTKMPEFKQSTKQRGA